MSLVDRLLAALLWLLAALAIGGITHIVAIFAMPGAAPRDAYARLAEESKPALLTILAPPPPEGGLPIPFADPALVQAICPFDLAKGGLRLHADVEGDRLLALSFRTRAGRVFYAMTDLAAQQNKMDVVVLTPEQLDAVEASDEEDNPSQDLRLIAPETQGFVLVSAFAPFPSERPEALARLKSVSCKVEEIAQE